jgi:AraC-like DNA-binding protein
MDFHKIANVTIDDVKAAHIADIAIQKQYGVKYHQFWVNETEGTVFCLVEGPDAATCERVHQLAHGNLACALTEVETGFYENLMGKDQPVDHQGLVQNMDGTVDLGYRNILVASVYGITKATSSKDFSLLLTPAWARAIITKTIASFRGRELKWDTDDSLIGIFDDTTDAVQCASQIQRTLLQNQVKQPQIIFKIGINASQPVTKEGNFFNEAIMLAHRLCTTAQNNRILTSALVKKLSNEQLLSDTNSIKSLNCKEEAFLSDLIHIAETKLSDHQFNLNRLSNEICISRPQLYRKVMSLTGRSPHEFVRDLQMNKALLLLKQNKVGIAQIAYETGFRSPSYFTKCFSQKFGCAPSSLVKTSVG